MPQHSLIAGAFARAQSFLTKISKRHEGVWQQVDGIRQLAHEHGTKWDRRCFIPTRFLNFEFQDPFPTRGRYSRPGKLEQSRRLRDVDVIAGLASWRLTKGIFVMSNEDVMDAREIGIPNDPDPKMFLHLPQPCIYVPTPGFSWLGDPLSGFFAYLNDDLDGELRLIILMDRDEPVFHSLTDVVHVRIEYQIHKMHEPVNSRADIIRNWKKGASGCGMDRRDRNLLQATVLGDYWKRPSLPNESPKHPEELLEILKSTLEEDILPIAGLLYRLCAITAEMPPASRPSIPKPKRTPSGFKMIPPQEITAWDAETRTRQLRKRPTSSGPGDGNQFGSTGQSKRTHSRNAHLRRLASGKQVQIPSTVVNAAATSPDDRPITAAILPPSNLS
ncbi:hypothetical protein [Pseudomonas fulva]|uniref:hypothetical protein n=1 Tax=Pseudomonas fulva TaxID=47880 RepID=UPI0037F7EF30